VFRARADRLPYQTTAAFNYRDRGAPDRDGRNDILAEAAGITAGSWYASGAGMLILASDGRRLPLDYGELER